VWQSWPITPAVTSAMMNATGLIPISGTHSPNHGL